MDSVSNFIKLPIEEARCLWVSFCGLDIFVAFCRRRQASGGCAIETSFALRVKLCYTGWKFPWQWLAVWFENYVFRQAPFLKT